MVSTWPGSPVYHCPWTKYRRYYKRVRERVPLRPPVHTGHAIPTLSTSIDSTRIPWHTSVWNRGLKEGGMLYAIEVGSISGPELHTSFAATSLFLVSTEEQ